MSEHDFRHTAPLLLIRCYAMMFQVHPDAVEFGNVVSSTHIFSRMPMLLERAHVIGQSHSPGVRNARDRAFRANCGNRKFSRVMRRQYVCRNSKTIIRRFEAQGSNQRPAPQKADDCFGPDDRTDLREHELRRFRLAPPFVETTTGPAGVESRGVPRREERPRVQRMKNIVPVILGIAAKLFATAPAIANPNGSFLFPCIFGSKLPS